MRSLRKIEDRQVLRKRTLREPHPATMRSIWPKRGSTGGSRGGRTAPYRLSVLSKLKIYCYLNHI